MKPQVNASERHSKEPRISQIAQIGAGNEGMDLPNESAHVQVRREGPDEPAPLISVSGRKALRPTLTDYYLTGCGTLAGFRTHEIDACG